ncbi:hypothetical protein MPSEU_001105400 [Mayamaea pseudoterrestris]|nr:hypothetical protein MPSEU_001105400 [Mayamaea pseudoterrestris]
MSGAPVTFHRVCHLPSCNKAEREQQVFVCPQNNNVHVDNSVVNNTNSLFRCSNCKEVCNEHFSNWITVRKNKTLNNLFNGNEAMNFCTANYQDSSEMTAKKLGNDTLARPLTIPFAELLGWSVEMYCSTTCNTFSDDGWCTGNAGEQINRIGVLLGTDPKTGQSMYPNIRGDIYLYGRRISDGSAMMDQHLFGIVAFIIEVMAQLSQEQNNMILDDCVLAYKAQEWQSSRVKFFDNGIYAAAPQEYTKL